MNNENESKMVSFIVVDKNNAKRLRVIVEEYGDDCFLRFETNEEAQKHLWNIFPYTDIEHNKSLEILLLRIGNDIARTSRRGMGNVLVYNPNSPDSKDIIEMITLNKLGKNRHFILEQSDSLPEDEVLLYYSGIHEFDKAFHWVDATTLVLNPNIEEYGRRIKI